MGVVRRVFHFDFLYGHRDNRLFIYYYYFASLLVVIQIMITFACFIQPRKELVWTFGNDFGQLRIGWNNVK